MTKIAPAPIYIPVVDESGVATLPWILFFNQLFTGDTGTAFTPVFTNLTIVGTPTFDAKYYKIGQNLVYFSLKITPATSTSATAGSTYFDFPLDITAVGAVFAVTGLLGSNAGMAEALTNRVYVPAWSVVTAPLTITGTLEAK